MSDVQKAREALTEAGWNYEGDDFDYPTFTLPPTRYEREDFFMDEGQVLPLAIVFDKGDQIPFEHKIPVEQSTFDTVTIVFQFLDDDGVGGSFENPFPGFDYGFNTDALTVVTLSQSASTYVGNTHILETTRSYTTAIQCDDPSQFFDAAMSVRNSYPTVAHSIIEEVLEIPEEEIELDEVASQLKQGNKVTYDIERSDGFTETYVIDPAQIGPVLRSITTPDHSRIDMTRQMDVEKLSSEVRSVRSEVNRFDMRLSPEATRIETKSAHRHEETMIAIAGLLVRRDAVVNAIITE